VGRVVKADALSSSAFATLTFFIDMMAGDVLAPALPDLGTRLGHLNTAAIVRHIGIVSAAWMTLMPIKAATGFIDHLTIPTDDGSASL
jgi:hypothetical protein